MRIPGKRSLTAGLRVARPAGGVPIDDAAQGSLERALGVELTRPSGPEAFAVEDDASQPASVAAAPPASHDED